MPCWKRCSPKWTMAKQHRGEFVMLIVIKQISLDNARARLNQKSVASCCHQIAGAMSITPQLQWMSRLAAIFKNEGEVQSSSVDFRGAQDLAQEAAVGAGRAESGHRGGAHAGHEAAAGDPPSRRQQPFLEVAPRLRIREQHEAPTGEEHHVPRGPDAGRCRRPRQAPRCH